MFFLFGLETGDSEVCLGKKTKTESINNEQVIEMKNNERKHCIVLALQNAFGLANVM